MRTQRDITVLVDLRNFGVDLGEFRGSPEIEVPDGWAIVSAVVQYTDPFVAVVDVVYQTPEGREQKTLILRRPAPVVLLVRGPFYRREVLIVTQVRHGAGSLTDELPGGMPKRDESEAACAAREATEETGITITEDQLTRIGCFHRDAARSPNLKAPVYLAELPMDTPSTAPAAEPGEHIVGTRWTPLSQVLVALANGDIHDPVLAGALGMVLAMPYRTV